MKKLLILAPLALLTVPVIAGPASADEVTIRTHRSDSGLHRGWSHAPAYGARRVMIRREHEGFGGARVTKKVTRTNEFGDRVTKKVTRDVD